MKFNILVTSLQYLAYSKQHTRVSLFEVHVDTLKTVLKELWDLANGYV